MVRSIFSRSYEIFFFMSFLWFQRCIVLLHCRESEMVFDCYLRFRMLVVCGNSLFDLADVVSQGFAKSFQFHLSMVDIVIATIDRCGLYSWEDWCHCRLSDVNCERLQVGLCMRQMRSQKRPRFRIIAPTRISRVVQHGGILGVAGAKVSTLTRVG